MNEATINGVKFTDKDIANPDDFFFDADSKTIRGYLLHDHGFVLAVAFADNLQDAFDIAFDAGKLNSFKVEESEMEDYENEEGLDFLGNFCEPCDIENVSVVEFDPPKLSICKLLS